MKISPMTCAGSPTGTGRLARAPIPAGSGPTAQEVLRSVGWYRARECRHARVMTHAEYGTRSPAIQEEEPADG